MPISLFSVPNRLNKLPEVCFEFSPISIGKSTIEMANHIHISTGQSYRIASTQILVHRWGGQNEDFGAVSQMDLTRVSVSFVALATKHQHDNHHHFLVNIVSMGPELKWKYMYKQDKTDRKIVRLTRLKYTFPSYSGHNLWLLHCITVKKKWKRS